MPLPFPSCRAVPALSPSPFARRSCTTGRRGDKAGHPTRPLPWFARSGDMQRRCGDGKPCFCTALLMRHANYLGLRVQTAFKRGEGRVRPCPGRTATFSMMSMAYLSVFRVLDLPPQYDATIFFKKRKSRTKDTPEAVRRCCSGRTDQVGGSRVQPD
jgi:hypothetical protein